MRKIIVSLWTGAGTDADPNRPLLRDVISPASWRDITGQSIANLAIAKNMYTIEADITPAQLATVQADSRFVVLPDVAGDTAALKSQLTTAGYNQDVADLVTLSTTTPAVIMSNLIAAQLRPPWKAGIAVTVGQVYTYQNNLYEVIQAHTTQSDWTPTAVPSLGAKQ